MVQEFDSWCFLAVVNDKGGFLNVWPKGSIIKVTSLVCLTSDSRGWLPESADWEAKSMRLARLRLCPATKLELRLGLKFSFVSLHVAVNKQNNNNISCQVMLKKLCASTLLLWLPIMYMQLGLLQYYTPYPITGNNPIIPLYSLVKPGSRNLFMAIPIRFGQSLACTCMPLQLSS